MAKRLRVWLGERVAISDVQGSRVDRDAGVIYGVKVLGHESKNGRRYLPEAVRAAAPLYEGASVRIDHPKRATDQRDSGDVLGWLRDVESRDDGLYADLHYLRSHPLAERLCEAAERNPNLFGLSHNADGTTETRGGETVVLEITEVRSVDLVADPATVGGLFEGRKEGRKVTIKLKAFLEAIKLPKKVKNGKKILARLFEAGMMDADLDMPADAAPPAEDAGDTDHEAALTGGFETSCIALIKKALAGEMDPTEVLKKLKEHLTAHGKLTGEGESESKPVEEEDDSDDDSETVKECKDEDDMKESKKLSRRVRELETREQVRELCESKNYTPSKAMLGALCRAPQAEREALIEEAKQAQQPPRRRPGNQPINEGKGTGTGTTKDIKDGKSFASKLRDGAFSSNN